MIKFNRKLRELVEIELLRERKTIQSVLWGGYWLKKPLTYSAVELSLIEVQYK